jgi:hypothetical protein
VHFPAIAGKEAPMQRFLISCAILLGFATTAAAQIGKNVSVAAGTDEDKALAAIYSAADGPGKVVLLDKFMTDFGKGDLELLGDELYVQTYLAQKNYAKVFEYGEKALALDPDSLSTVVNMVHAAEEQGDAEKLFAIGEKTGAIVARYKASPAPEGTSAKDWDTQKDDSLKNSQADIGYVEYTLVNVAFKTPSPAARAAYLERYVAAFPESPYTASSREQLAFSYQQAQNLPKMVETAQGILATDPDNVSMLVLLADYWSENGQQLDKAAANAQKALDILAKATKPENLTDQQWQQQVSLQKGLAYSSLGQVYVNMDHNTEAVTAFKQASPLLKSDTYSYARNLYRLGFTLAKLKRLPEARTVLVEDVSINSPYKARAQETLDKIGGAGPRHTPHKNP